MEKKKNITLSTTSSEKPLEFTKLVDEAEEKQKEAKKFIDEDMEKVPPVEEKPKKGKKLSEAEKIKRKRQADVDYREKKKKETEKILAEPALKPFELIDKEVMKAFAGVVPFGILAMFLKDDKYLCNDREKDILALQWDKYMRVRMPDVFDKYGPEWGLALPMCMILIEKSGVFKPGMIDKEFPEGKTKQDLGIKGYGQ